MLFVESTARDRSLDRNLIAALLGVKFKKAFPAVIFGYLHSDCHYVVHILCGPLEESGDLVCSLEYKREALAFFCYFMNKPELSNASTLPKIIHSVVKCLKMFG